MDAGNKFALPITALVPTIDPDQLGFSDTSELEPLEDPIGQERAVEALEFGLHMPNPGFHIFVAGPTGTGKGSLVRRMVQHLARSAPTAPDWCYVNNFLDPSQPIPLSFSAGQGRGFQQAMETCVQTLRRDIPAMFEGKPYLDARAKISEETSAQKKALFHELHEFGRKRGFGFEELPMGFGIVPLKEGRRMTDEELEQLSQGEHEAIDTQRKDLENEIREFQVRIHALDHEAERRHLDLDRQVATRVLGDRLEPLRQTYVEMSEVCAYLDHVRTDIIEHYKDFLPHEKSPLTMVGFEAGAPKPSLTRYRVNLLVEHRPDGGAPVVDETHPTYTNLVGKIERKAHLGVLYTDFTEIKAGALLLASGGYLILDALDVLRQPFAWDALKRALKSCELKIEDAGDFFGFSTIGLKPRPIPVNVKVILVGPPALYQLLQIYEADFRKIFKVKADFDVDVRRDERLDRQYAQFISRVCRDERLPPFGKDAVAEVLREAFRMAERRDRLSLRFSLIGDLVREAAFCARRANRPVVSRSDVETAVAQKRRRSDILEHWVQDEIREGTLMVDLSGTVVGQVNGLSVHVLGDYAFGRPCRITARTFIGTKGVIDIQREAELAGSIHSKGVLTLAGFLAGQFAGTHPFALSSTLTFEQTYSEVEGDSAAAAELIAILSSLANAPVRQNLAITGSINQLGEIQPIGGVNEKIEGFYESCSRRGFTGDQGVIIPARNMKHLALKREVVDAVAAGHFSIYGVNTVEEAIELMTGIPAGECDENGHFAEQTLYQRVDLRLEDMADVVAEWSQPIEAEAPESASHDKATIVGTKRLSRVRPPRS
ncbi:ATP-dependent protease [Nitrospira sp.]|nr:ATP-dependent protease [Nitrospira sp.]